MESLESSKAPQIKSLEGTIITGRDLAAYERMLGFDRELLQGKTVLNFGPGMTHLGEQLGERGVTSAVVNLDITKEPLISTHDVVRYGATLTLDLYRRLLEKFGADTAKVQELQRRFKGIKDKTFVQYDGRKIPFADGSFDHVLALWSTYQIPHGEREGVYRELMRVGKHIHIGPIGKVDFTMLLRLADTQGFDVVACESLYIRDMKRRIGQGVQMKTLEDYEAYMRNRSVGDRIAEPLIDDLTFEVPGSSARMLHPISGGSTIILKKRNALSMGEVTPNEVYVGVGKPDGLPVAESFDKAQGEAPLDKARGETHPAEPFDKTQGKGAVKRAVSAWWERVGPGGVEKSWVNAHKKILMQIKETEKRAAFEATAETWRKVGKFFGIASIVVDFSLSGVGLVLMGRGLQNPLHTEEVFADLIGKSKFTWLDKFYYRVQMGKHLNTKLKDIPDGYIEKRASSLGIAQSLVPGVGAAGIALGVGPAHLGTRLLAKEVELAGTLAAKVENYFGTGKAAEHAEVVGDVLDKGFKVIAKNPEIVPEKYRKTVEIIAEASEKEEQARKVAELQRRIQEKEQLKREYQMWKDEMDPAEKSYYELSGREPSMEDFVEKAKAGFEKDKKKQMEKAEEKRE